MRLTRGRREAAIATAVYFVTAVYLMWPVPEHPGSVIYGTYGDVTGSIATYRELAAGPHNPFLPGTLPDFDAPRGLPISWALNVATFPSTALLFGLTLVVGAVSAYFVYTFLGYVASGLAMFLLARKLTGHVGAALVAGWAFAFYPFPVVNGGGHNAFVHGWPVVLLVWRMLELAEKPTRRNGLLAGAATAFCFLWTPYFILIGGVAYATLAVASLVVAARRRAVRTHAVPQATAAGVVFAVLVCLFAVNAASSDASLRQNGLEALYVFSARPAELLLPTVGPLSRWTADYLSRNMHGSNVSEVSIYLGLSMLALSIVGVVAAVRARAATRRARATLFACVLALVAVAFSAPPRGDLLGLRIPMPSLLVYDITPTWRVFARFVILAMLAVCLMAAAGIAELTRGRRSATALAITGVCAVVVAVDLWARNPNYHTALVTPGIYKVLRELPPGVVAEYPLQPFGYGLYTDLFFQEAHGHPVLNGYPEGSAEEAQALALSNLSSPSTSRGLAALGVRYVLVRTQPDAPSPGTPGRGFVLIDRDAFGSLYRVASRGGSAVLAFPVSGFSQLEPAPTGHFSWMVANPGTIQMTGQCRPCRGTLSLRAQSFAQPRTLVISGPAARRTVTVRIPARSTLVRVPVEFVREGRLELTTSPGPQSIAETLGTPDTRTVSVNIAGIRFTPEAR